MTGDIVTSRILEQLRAGNVGLAIAETETYLAAWPQVQTAERLSDIKKEYELMVGYWRQGMADPQLEEQYARLLQRMYVLYSNVIISRCIQGSSFLKGLYSGVRQSPRDWSVSFIRREMENFVSEVALLALEPENQREGKSRSLYQAHQQQMRDLFNYVLTSRMWTESVGRGFTEILLSPTIDNIDQQLLVSAVMLSLIFQFDMVKFRMLTDVYRKSQDEYVRQRALVGWVFALDDSCMSIYPEQRRIVEGLLKSEKVCKELTELQIQLVYTLNAEKDTAIIQKEIMPDLLKNHQFHITRNGLEEQEDTLEDVLHPDAAEQRMEKLESTFRRMQDMQQQGVDIYFGGFSQMKRFPFFYDISNWLVPFYMQHPDIAQFVQRMEYKGFLNQLVLHGPFCNSDKYSFVIAFMDVVNKLPESMRQAMKHGEASLDEMALDNQSSPAYIRRIYLMDLYRFFRLFPNRSAFHNPFEADAKRGEPADCFFFCSSLFSHTPLDDCRPDVVRVLKKYKYEREADVLLAQFPERMHDVQYYLWKGDYDAALELDPDHERALAGRARRLFDQGMYEDAANDYARLMLLQPGKVSYMLNRAVCLLNADEFEDALQMLYQLDYEHPDDMNVQRVLAWALTCDGRLEQADKTFRRMQAAGGVLAEDYLNYGYCMWLQGNIDAAVAHFKTYVEKTPDMTDGARLFDDGWLEGQGISTTQIKMMKALVLGPGA